MASQALIKEFEDLLGKENVFSSEADRQSYSYDSAVLPPVVPAFARIASATAVMSSDFARYSAIRSSPHSRR